MLGACLALMGKRGKEETWWGTEQTGKTNLTIESVCMACVCFMFSIEICVCSNSKALENIPDCTTPLFSKGFFDFPLAASTNMSLGQAVCANTSDCVSFQAECTEIICVEINWKHVCC